MTLTVTYLSRALKLTWSAPHCCTISDALSIWSAFFVLSHFLQKLSSAFRTP